MKVILALLSVIFFVACGGPPAYHVTPTKVEDNTTYQWQDGTATFDITSESGIGGARFVREYGNAPKKILLQLHLKGLESLKLRYADNEITVSMPSSSAPDVIQSARIGSGGEMELTPDSEYWMPTSIVSVMETVPLVDGYFQVELPRAFYASNPEQFSIEWIDFFR